MTASRHERCQDCKEMKPVDDFSINRWRKYRSQRNCYCRDCARKHRDIAALPDRLKEIDNIEFRLSLDKYDPDRMRADFSYAWFRKKALADDNFEYTDGEPLMAARLRWLKQRTESING